MRLFPFAALGLSLAACTPAPAVEAPAAPAAEQPATPETAPAPETPPLEMPVPGGYGPASLEDERVKAAQAVAIAEIQKRDPAAAAVETVKAEQQVVAGMNYHFEITLAGGAHYSVKVFESLRGEPLEVTGFAKLN